MTKPSVKQIEKSDLNEREKYELLSELGLALETEVISDNISSGAEL